MRGERNHDKNKRSRGRLTDNRRLQAEGKVEKTEGNTPQKIGHMTRRLQ